MCRRIGEHGAHALPPNARVLTHCNAGALATGGIGTALAPLYLAAEQGRALHVFADETRPLLQGSRLTAWELRRRASPSPSSPTAWRRRSCARRGRPRASSAPIASPPTATSPTRSARMAWRSRRTITASRSTSPRRWSHGRSRDGDGRDIPIEERDARRDARHGRRDGAAGRRRGLQSRVRRHAGRADHRDHHGPRRDAAAISRSLADGHPATEQGNSRDVSSRPSARLAPLDAHCARLAGCRRCGSARESSPITSRARAPRAMLVGQAPGKTEMGGGRPFAGRAGKTLFRWLERAGMDEATARDWLYISAITRCFPGPHPGGRGDRVPSPRSGPTAPSGLMRN